jgi:enamine deaminase RidA (YjgF/YER057c/UK114 family)
MRKRHLSLLLGTCAALTLLAAIALPGKKKDPAEQTQTLALPKDPPQVAVGETRRLLFHVSPLSGKGLLSQQTRDALKAILKANGGAPVVHLRAFVSGSGDIRRVPQIVSDFFTDKKQALPSVSVALAGGLPLDNAQVVLEAVSLGRREANADGLDFIAGEESTASDPAAPPQSLLEKTLHHMASKVNAQSVLRISCFVSSMNNPAQLTSAIHSRFPAAAIDLVQTQRAPMRALANCQAVARGGKVTAGKLAFTGTQVAFGAQEKDALLAFQRLDRDLTDASASPSGIVFTNVYALSGQTGEMVRKLRASPSIVPAIIPFEGLASIDAGFAVDAIAAVIN